MHPAGHRAEDGPLRYRSEVVCFGVWCAAVGGVGLWSVVAALRGEASFAVAAGALAILGGGLWSQYTEVTLRESGDLEFRGALRRRVIPLSRLAEVDSRGTAVVFRFVDGSGAMLPPAGKDLGAFVRYLQSLNPAIETKRRERGHKPGGGGVEPW